MALTRLEKAVISHCLPGLFSLARDMKNRLLVETHRDTGELKSNIYASVDDVSGEIEVGYDEIDSLKPHGFYYIFGTSHMKGDPAIQRTVYRRYRSRKGNE